MVLRKELGRTKARELAKLARAQGQHFDCAPWVHKARALSRDQFKQEVERELTGNEPEPWEIVYFKLYKSQILASFRRRIPILSCGYVCSG